MRNINAQIDKAHKRVVAEATEVIRAVAIDAYSELQKPSDEKGGSPIASGQYAASMRLSLNYIDRSFAPADPAYDYPPPSVHKYDRANLPGRSIRNRPISGVSAKLRNFRLGDTIFISNSAPHAREIEVGGKSWQTPDGVFEYTMRLVIARFSNLNLRIRTFR